MGCCGNKRAANTEYEVTFRDGSTARVATLLEARVAASADTTSDPSGRRKAATHRLVAKAKAS